MYTKVLCTHQYYLEIRILTSWLTPEIMWDGVSVPGASLVLTP